MPYAQQVELIPRTKDERIAELESALRDALELIDGWWGGDGGEPGETEKRCRRILRDKLSPAWTRD